MRIKTLTLLLLLAMAVSAGITMEVNAKLSRDGYSQISMKVNLTQLISASSAAQISNFDTLLERQMCANMTNHSMPNQNYSVIECRVTGGVFYLSGASRIPTPKTTFDKEEGFPYVTYYYHTSPQGGSLWNITSQIALMRMLNASATYSIEIPGELYETNGKIEDNKAVFDLMDFALSGKEGYAKSREPNFMLLSVALATLLAVAAIIAFIRLKQARERKPHKK